MLFLERERDLSRPKDGSVAAQSVSENYAWRGTERKKGRWKGREYIILHKNLVRQELLYPLHRLGTRLRDMKLPARLFLIRKRT